MGRMSKTGERDWRAAKRLARYLKEARGEQPSIIFRICREKLSVVGHGLRRLHADEEKHFRGITFGEPCETGHSHTQDAVALSSRRSEFYGRAESATIGRGAKGQLGDMGIKLEAQIRTSSSAARSIA